MTDRIQPEALRLADWLDGCGGLTSKSAAAELRRQHARIADLAAQLEAIGAGGVTGPLVGQPQAMPDLSQLTERGAQAWAGVDAQGLREGFTAADMATAEARGFRDGVASVAASAASEPVIGWHAFPHYLQNPDGRLLRTASDLLARHGYTGCAEPLRAMSDVLLSTHPSPPEGMAGWQDIATAPKNGREVLGYTAEVGALVLYWDTMGSETDRWSDGMSTHSWAPTHWMPLPAPPLASEAKGESHE